MALSGVGDARLGEWTEWTGRAYHVRRRLTPDEQVEIGEVIDVRGTTEGTERVAVLLRGLSFPVRAVIADVAAAELAGESL